MMGERFVFVEGEHPCIYDKVGKRKYYFNDDLCDRLNSLWVMSLRFEEYSKRSKKQLDCLEQAMEQVFENPEPTIEKIIKVYNNLKSGDGV